MSDTLVKNNRKVFKQDSLQFDTLSNHHFTKDVRIDAASVSMLSHALSFDSAAVFRLGLGKSEVIRSMFKNDTWFHEFYANNIAPDTARKFTYLSLIRCHFDGEVRFNSPFNLSIHINDSEFEKQIYLSRDYVHRYFIDGFVYQTHDQRFKTVEFNKVTFRSAPVLDGSEIDTLIFDGSSMLFDRLDLNRIQLKDSPRFTNCLLPKSIVFADIETAHWKSDLDLRTNGLAYEGKKCEIVFNYRIKTGETISSSLDGSKFIIPSDRFTIRFGDRFPDWQKLVVIDQIRNRCKKEGMFQSADHWDILYKKLVNTNRWAWWGNVINFVEEYWWNFGYSEWIVVAIWMPVTFIIFWILNLLNIHKILSNVYFDAEMGSNFAFLDLHPTKNTPPGRIYKFGNYIFRAFSRFIFLLQKLLSKQQAEETATPPDKIDEVSRPVVLETFSQRLSYSFFLTAVLYFGFKVKHESVNYRNGSGMAYIYFLYLVGTFHVAYTIGFLLKG